MQNKIIRVAALVAVAGAGLAWGGYDRARLEFAGLVGQPGIVFGESGRPGYHGIQSGSYPNGMWSRNSHGTYDIAVPTDCYEALVEKVRAAQAMRGQPASRVSVPQACQRVRSGPRGETLAGVLSPAFASPSSGNRNLPAYTTGNQAAGTLPQSGCAKDYPYAQPNLGDLNSGCVGRKTNEGQCTCLGLTFGQNGCDPAWTWCSKTPIPQN